MIAFHPILELPGRSPVSAPASNMATMTTFIGIGGSLAGWVRKARRGGRWNTAAAYYFA